jgi:hypothetical protein
VAVIGRIASYRQCDEEGGYYSERQLFALAFILALTSGLFQIQMSEAKTLFEDNFSQGGQKWDLVDNGGKISLQKGSPPEYGPDVLVLESPAGINVLAFIKEGFDDFEDGIIEVLWRDKEIAEGAVADRDADGPLIFRVQGPPGFVSLYLIEYDVDAGFHFDIVGGAGVQGAGPKNEGKWNWVKARRRRFASGEGLGGR